jgi:hypothetical protein
VEELSGWARHNDLTDSPEREQSTAPCILTCTAAALPVAQTFRDHGCDERIQTYALSPGPLHQPCVKGLGNSLSPLAAGGREGAGRRNRIAKFLDCQQTALQSVAPVNDCFFGGFAVRHAAGNIGKFD